MKFNFDTNNYETMKTCLSDVNTEEDLTLLIQDFSYGMGAFFLDFALSLNFNTKQAEKLKELVLEHTERNIDFIIESNLLGD